MLRLGAWEGHVGAEPLVDTERRLLGLRPAVAAVVLVVGILIARIALAALAGAGWLLLLGGAVLLVAAPWAIAVVLFGALRLVGVGGSLLGTLGRALLARRCHTYTIWLRATGDEDVEVVFQGSAQAVLVYGSDIRVAGLRAGQRILGASLRDSTGSTHVSPAVVTIPAAAIAVLVVAALLDQWM